MRFNLRTGLALALAVDAATASTWFSKAVYNKWHETELERWLSDNNVPYPTPADRKDLENLIKDNWDAKVVKPYNEWDAGQLEAWLKKQGIQTEAKAAKNKDALVSQVKGTWTETADAATSSYASVRDWVFDSWTDSQLKAFADKHGIPVPQPRKRDSLLKSVRENYEASAKKINEYAAYPGDWLYEAWSDSDLKQFLDERGVPVPQPSARDKLIAAVRRNSRVAALTLKGAVGTASASAAAAQKTAADAILDAWSDSQIKEWADKHGINVPQGSKRNELIAIGRRNQHLLFESAASAYGAATSKAGNEYAKASDDASLAADDAFNTAVDGWSNSRLKAFLDSRGVPVPQANKRDELLASVRLNKHKASTGFTAWTFDTWTAENLQAWLKSQNHKAAKKSGQSRDELLKYAQDSYASASKAGGNKLASATNYLTQQTAAAKDQTFDTWSESDLKHYLDSYGISTYQGSSINELRAMARRNSNYFRYGTTTPQGTLFAKIQDGVQWVLDQVKVGAASGRDQAGKVGDAAAEQASVAKHRAQEAAQSASHRAKEEL